VPAGQQGNRHPLEQHVLPDDGALDLEQHGLAPPSRVAGTTTCGSLAGVSVATSSFGSAAATVAVAVVPSAKVTVMVPPLAMTWFAVKIVPLSATMTPVPRSRLVRTRTTDGPAPLVDDRHGQARGGRRAGAGRGGPGRGWPTGDLGREDRDHPRAG